MSMPLETLVPWWPDPIPDDVKMIIRAEEKEAMRRFEATREMRLRLRALDHAFDGLPKSQEFIDTRAYMVNSIQAIIMAPMLSDRMFEQLRAFNPPAKVLEMTSEERNRADALWWNGNGRFSRSQTPPDAR